MMLDCTTSLVRRFGPIRLAFIVTALTVIASGLATLVAMTLVEGNVFPALYLAVFTPLVLALPTLMLAFLAIEKGDLAKQKYDASRQQAHEAHAILNDAIASIPNPMLILDAQDRVTLFNNAWRDHYPDSAHAIQPGTEYEDLIRYVVSTGLWDPMGSREDVLADRLRRHRDADGSFVQELADGRSILVYEGRSSIGARIITHTDVTDLKRVDRLKDEFISTVSHELRTPLTSIKGALDLLADDTSGGKTRDDAKLITIAQRNANRLLTLVNDILDVQAIEAGRLVFDLRPTAVAPLLERSIAAVAVFADRFGVDIRFTDDAADASVIVDANRFDQVLANLVSNAAKFAPRGSTVTINTRRVDGYVRIAVHDEGPGIPSQHHEQVFDRFWQADTSDARGVSGTGLGLSISKKIVDGMGGRIGFVSQPGEGTTFHFDLPDSGTT